MQMANYFEFAAALFAFAAAVFWFFSASKNIPALESYWDAIPSDHPFFKAMRFTAKMNRWAAGLSGLSAVCVAASISVGRL